MALIGFLFILRIASLGLNLAAGRELGNTKMSMLTLWVLHGP